MPLVNVSFTDIQAIDSVGVPPLPIPNREVKPNSADGTAKLCGRVGHRRFYKRTSTMMSFFLYIRQALLSLVMLACRIPRGSIFGVATRDYLLLALTNQPSAALWESRSSPFFLERVPIQFGTLFLFKEYYEPRLHSLCVQASFHPLVCASFVGE